MGLADFLAGWALGAKAGNRGFDEIITATKAVVQSKEFKDLTSAARAHAGYTLHQLGDLLSAEADEGAGADVLDMVRTLTHRQSDGSWARPGQSSSRS
jgi:hypothetical protein